MTSRSSQKLLIKNASVFDGEKFVSGRDVAIENGVLVSEVADAGQVVDGAGGFLVPGLIDCHVHVHSEEDLATLARQGVTTSLDMGTARIGQLNALRGGRGISDVRTSGIIATSPGTRHGARPGFPVKDLVHGPQDADRFVTDRITEGADYIKIMMEKEGPAQDAVDALTKASRKHKKRSVAHATTNDAVSIVVAAGVDVVTHVPLEQSLEPRLIEQMKSSGSVSVPTLIKMYKTAAKEADQGTDYENARKSVEKLHRAKVPILTGTDANKQSTGLGRVSYGSSMYDELELLVEAGLSPLEALQSATTLVPMYFELFDRGSIEAGKRADLILLAADPLEDISNMRQIRRVWCGGVETTNND